MKQILFILFFVLYGVLNKGYSQSSDQQVSNVQRAIYIYNLAEQVNWANDLGETLKVGVLGPDRTIISLRALSKSRQIKSRPVTVKNFLSVKDVENIDLLYVHKKYNFEMSYILRTIKNKGILVVSEDYTFDDSMVNIIKVGTSFRHQINEEVLLDNDFKIASSLKSYAIKSSQKWMSLFKEVRDSLVVVKDANNLKDLQLKEQSKVIEQKEVLIDTIQKRIKQKDVSIQELISLDQLQKKTINEKRQIAIELETKIQEQFKKFKEQSSTITLQSYTIKKQNDSINQQISKILTQKETLRIQKEELRLKEKINWLLGIIALLLLAAGVMAYRSYKTKNKHSKQLALQNSQITRQKDELLVKNEDLEQFAYIASHDLQEPLNTISSFIGLIEADYNEKFDEVGRQSLAFITDASERMKHLIDVLLEYSRIGKNRKFVSVNTHLVLSHLEQDLSALIDRRKASVIYKDLPTVKGSELELRLLFQNLITNALKFCPDDRAPKCEIQAKKIISKTIPDQQFWEFSVSDNGIGIDRKFKERIFSIFQRLHTKDEYEGSGIGLAHCKKIVALHGGDIWFTSIKGEGTTFHFTLTV